MTTFGVGIPCPEPGYYPGVPADVYHQWDACSNSRLQLIRRSPAHLRSHILTASGETDALRLGSAVHMAILEPEIFSVRYAEKKQCKEYTEKGKGPRCTKLGKHLLMSGEVVCGTHLGGQPINENVALLDPDDWAACREMRAAVTRKRRAAGLVGAAGDFELSIVWDEEVPIVVDGKRITTTVRCRGRLDHYSPDLDGGTILDLKTTEDAEEEEFAKSIYKWNYHWQGGLYSRGCGKLPRPLPVKHYAILAMEKKPPYEVGVFRLTEGALDAGEQMAMKYLQLYARCQYTGDWPGYPDRVRDVALPDWAWKQMDDELQQLEEAWPQ